MSDLKTYNQIRSTGNSQLDDIKLRRVVIKYIKYLEKNYQNENINNSIYERGLIARGKVQFIKEFFTITEEDLQ